MCNAQRTENSLSYLSDTIARYGSYHDHKESIAWASIVFFGVVSSFIVGQDYSAGSEEWLKPVLTLILMINYLVVIIFMDKQQRMRSFAADMHKACNALSVMIISGDVSIVENNFRLATSKEQNDYSRIPGKEFLPILLLDELKNVRRHPRRTRAWLEWLTYLLLSFLLLASLLIVWIVE